MEVVIKLGRLKTNAKGNIEMSRKDFREFLKPYVKEIGMVTLLSCVAWLMEEPEFAADRERLTSIFENSNRIMETVYDPNEAFGKKELAKVVSENTNIKVRWVE